MSRTGWCRECSDWVAVDEEGACPQGHCAEALSRVHDVDSPEEAAAISGSEARAIPVGVGDFGVGELPANIQRFNWGAFLLPALWGVVYSVWPIAGAWFVAAFAPLFLSLVFGVTGPGGAIAIPALIGVTVVSDALLAFVRLWAGGSANRLLWEREALRLRTKPGALPKFTTRTYPVRQRLWLLWGIAGLVGGLVFTVFSNYQLMQPYGLGIAFVAEPIVFIGAQIGLAFWLGRKMREEYPDAATPAA